MKNEQMNFTFFMVIIAIILIILLWTTGLIGAMNLTNGCLYRYNFDDNNNISDLTGSNIIEDDAAVKANE